MKEFCPITAQRELAYKVISGMAEHDKDFVRANLDYFEIHFNNCIKQELEKLNYAPKQKEQIKIALKENVDIEEYWNEYQEILDDLINE